MAQVICLVTSDMRSDLPTSVSTGWLFNADAKRNYSESCSIAGESSHHYKPASLKTPIRKVAQRGEDLGKAPNFRCRFHPHEEACN
jgi:hypothetical protein